MTDIRDAREIDAAAIATVHVASWRAAYRGLLPDDVLDALSVAERTERWAGHLRRDTGSSGERALRRHQVNVGTAHAPT